MPPDLPARPLPPLVAGRMPALPVGTNAKSSCGNASPATKTRATGPAGCASRESQSWSRTPCFTSDRKAGTPGGDKRQVELWKPTAPYEDAGHGACWLREPRIAKLVENALLHFDTQRYRLLAWCVM